ncbi:hypothetical protein B5G20_09995 [Collinsella sp. An7]|uniref:hypothetical protein n=1 Tax=Collinsella sp. An7 TaxID=1965651 RepID=UPI000B39FF0F|nr:hypothetical protein [Collinsella sp. An7]OUN45193.1 hypothetical protein B5G20_09995 [Collinsella sp. An7]
MVTSIEKADVLFASGRSRAYPVALEFGDAGVVEFDLDNEVGLTVERRRGSLPGFGKLVSWACDKILRHDKLGRTDIEERSGRSVLLPIEVLRREGDEVVSVTTTTGSAWVLSGDKYVSVAGAGSCDGAVAQTCYLGAGGFGSVGGAAEREKQEGKEMGDGRELG